MIDVPEEREIDEKLEVFQEFLAPQCIYKLRQCNKSTQRSEEYTKKYMRTTESHPKVTSGLQYSGTMIQGTILLG
jgi:hypothetical protein